MCVRMYVHAYVRVCVYVHAGQKNDNNNNLLLTQPTIQHFQELILNKPVVSL